MENNQDQSNTQQVSTTSENVITTPQTNLLQTYIQSHENTNNPKTSEEVTRTGKHDASGHCQQVVHVSSHTRNGHQVNAYDRLCGQNHTKKEAEEKNQEEDIQQNQEENSSDNMRQKYDSLIKDYWPELIQNENMKEFAYLDTEGNITTGMGLYIPDRETFVSLPWQCQGKEASYEQKIAEYQRLENFQKNGQFGKNYDSDYYWEKSKLKLTLSEHFIIDKTMKHVEGDLKALEKKLPEFETYPRPLQKVLLDFQYNMGGNFTSEKWPAFYEGLKNKDITKMAEESNRSQVGETRNNWVKRTLKEIPVINEWHYSST